VEAPKYRYLYCLFVLPTELEFAFMQPEQAIVLMETSLLPSFSDEHGITRGIIEAIPADKAEYRPHSIARTTFELARHIVATERRLVDGVVSGEISRGVVLPEGIESPKDLATWYAESFHASFGRLERLSGEQLVKLVSFRGGKPHAILCFQFALNHSIHHRGQLSTYLRAMGARVPSIYGESFEDAEARKAERAQSGVA
jgi:uncharacterized damage-inducible protein DinB